MTKQDTKATKKKSVLPNLNDLRISASYKNLDLSSEVAELLSTEQKTTLAELAHKKLNPDYNAIALDIYNQFLEIAQFFDLPRGKIGLDFTTKICVPDGLATHLVIAKINKLLKDNDSAVSCIVFDGDNYNTSDYFIFSTDIKFFNNF